MSAVRAALLKPPPGHASMKSAFDPIVIDRAKAQLRESIEMIPLNEKSAYLKALRRAPQLIGIESPMERFLLFDNYNPWSAARRIVNYWEKRVEIFGERAFLPLLLSGEGALDKDDLECMNTGFLMLLPEDKHGRTVMFHDRARLTSPAVLDETKRLRCLFYILNAASESERCQRNGIVALTAYGEKTRASTFDRRSVSTGIALVQCEAIPVSIKGVHLVMLSRRPILDIVIPATVQILERWNFLKQQIVVHTRKEKEDILQSLCTYGFDPEGIPKVPLGGYWTLGCFKRWMDDRLILERQTYSRAHPQGPGVASMWPQDGDEAAHQEDEARMKREIDAAYARRKRARKKIEIEVTQEEVERLKRQKQRLENTGVALERQLNDARRIVELYAEDPSLSLYPHYKEAT